MEESDVTAIVALLVSLVALGVALGQLIQQYFATADGYRRCQDSVMGPWASATRLRWRWRELRFETRFTSPQFELLDTQDMLRAPKRRETPAEQPHHGAVLTFYRQRSHNPQRKTDEETSLRRYESAEKAASQSRIPHRRHYEKYDYPITDTSDEVPDQMRIAAGAAAHKTRLLPHVRSTASDHVGDLRRQRTELVTWASLFRSLYRYQQDVDEDSRNLPSYEHAQVTIKLNEWSWDLVPPDIVRPYATCTVGTLVSLVHRLGMQWTALNPSKGEMSAEGNGHDISSTTVRGLGTVLTYIFNEKLNFTRFSRRIPTQLADKLRCGIIPSDGSEGLGVGEHSLVAPNGSLGPFTYFLRHLKVPRSVEAILTDPQNLNSLENRQSLILHVFNDLVCISVPFLPVRGDFRNNITWPLKVYAFSSPLIFKEGRAVLLRRIRESSPNSEALGSLERLEKTYPDNYYARWNTAISRGEQLRELIAFLHGIYDQTTATFHAKRDQLNYTDLVAAHVVLSTTVREDARAVVRSSIEIPTTPAEKIHVAKGNELTAYVAQAAELYVDNIEIVVKHLQDECGCHLQSKEIEGLWWLMMVRGICWSMSVDLSMQQSVVPSYLYYSSTTVYII